MTKTKCGSSRIASIDPGLAKVAVAIWNSERDFALEWAGLVLCDHSPGTERAQKWREMAEAVFPWLWMHGGEPLDMVVEVPQVYGGVHKEDPNDLLDLTGVLGAIVGGQACNSVAWSPLPREWKGQLPKEITQSRVDAKLSALEKSCIEWPIKSLRHNVYDAIHLGIVHLEREGLRTFAK